MNKKILSVAVAGTLALLAATSEAALITDPNDGRSWQGASVGTFADLYYGSNTLANRQSVVDNKLLDDGIFNSTGYAAASLMSTPWSTAAGAGRCKGTSYDTTGTGNLSYGCKTASVFTNANGIDNLWFQSSGIVGETVFDLGFQANKAAVFNSIDHGPLPGEAIESTVYLSDDLINWTIAVVERVWLEGFDPNLGIKWDGFTYAVGTGTSSTFRYASVTHGGPSALRKDGDDEINGIMGLKSNYQPGVTVPEPATLFLVGLGFAGIGFAKRKRQA